MIRFDAVLCDFDGVLRHHGQGGHEALEREYGLPEGTVLKLALAPEYVVPATLGPAARRRGGPGHPRQAPGEGARGARHQRHHRAGGRPGPPRAHALRRRRGHSARVGAAKPDPRIYEIAAERAGAVPGRCVFIDDRLENVEAARALGMTGVHYGAPADLTHLLA